jgi:hypothetical protein
MSKEKDKKYLYIGQMSGFLSDRYRNTASNLPQDFV